MAILDDIEIPDDLDIRIEKLVQDGEFLNYDEAIKQLLSAGLTTYRTDDTVGDEFDEDDMYAAPPHHEDDYIF